MCVLGNGVLLQSVALREALVAKAAKEVLPSLVDCFHVFLQTASLHRFATYDTIEVLVSDDHLIVQKSNVTIHVAEVGKHLLAMGTLVPGYL